MGEQQEERGGGSGVIIAIVVVLGALLGAAIVVPNVMEARKQGGEAPPIGALKTIGTAQSLFREADKEADGNLDYGTLEELAGGAGQAYLIDAVLGSGTKAGYVFECSYSAPTSEFMWFAVASPALPGVTGDRYFATNHEGVIFYTTSGSFSLNTIDCTMPSGALPVGR